VVKESRGFSERESLLSVRLDEPVKYNAGQFLMAGLPGFGEAAISISSPPGRGRSLELCIRNAGSLTAKLCALDKNEVIWLRGPMGRGFPMPRRDEDLLFITGGMGLVPARSLIKAVMKKRSSYGKITILYGIKTPAELLFAGEIKQWEDKGAEVMITVDSPQPSWSGKTGVVTKLIGPLPVDGPRTSAFVVGPPAMYRYVVMPLSKKGVSPEKTFLSLERRMRCGIGRCGHCLIGGVYSCACGPVFSLTELADMPGAI